MITHHCHECGEEVEEVCDEHPNAHVDTIVHGACGAFTGETITDEQIRELRATESPVTGNCAYLCAIALGELRDGRMGSSRAEERNARARCAEILNARIGAKS